MANIFQARDKEASIFPNRGGLLGQLNRSGFGQRVADAMLAEQKRREEIRQFNLEQKDREQKTAAAQTQAQAYAKSVGDADIARAYDQFDKWVAIYGTDQFEPVRPDEGISPTNVKLRDNAKPLTEIQNQVESIKTLFPSEMHPEGDPELAKQWIMNSLDTSEDLRKAEVRSKLAQSAFNTAQLLWGTTNGARLSGMGGGGQSQINLNSLIQGRAEAQRLYNDAVYDTSSVQLHDKPTATDARVKIKDNWIFDQYVELSDDELGLLLDPSTIIKMGSDLMVLRPDVTSDPSMHKALMVEKLESYAMSMVERREEWGNLDEAKKAKATAALRKSIGDTLEKMTVGTQFDADGTKTVNEVNAMEYFRARAADAATAREALMYYNMVAGPTMGIPSHEANEYLGVGGTLTFRNGRVVFEAIEGLPQPVRRPTTGEDQDEEGTEVPDQVPGADGVDTAITQVHENTGEQLDRIFYEDEAGSSPVPGAIVGQDFSMGDIPPDLSEEDEENLGFSPLSAEQDKPLSERMLPFGIGEDANNTGMFVDRARKMGESPTNAQLITLGMQLHNRARKEGHSDTFLLGPAEARDLGLAFHTYVMENPDLPGLKKFEYKPIPPSERIQPPSGRGF